MEIQKMIISWHGSSSRHLMRQYSSPAIIIIIHRQLFSISPDIFMMQRCGLGACSVWQSQTDSTPTELKERSSVLHYFCLKPPNTPAQLEITKSICIFI